MARDYILIPTMPKPAENTSQAKPSRVKPGDTAWTASKPSSAWLGLACLFEVENQAVQAEIQA